MLGAVRALRIKAKGTTIAQHADSLSNGFVVGLDGADTVADAIDGEDTEPAQDARHSRTTEHIGTRHEDHLMPFGQQHHQRVHEGAGVIGDEDDAAILRHLFPSAHVELPKATPYSPLHRRKQEGISSVVILDVLAHLFFYLFGPENGGDG